MNDNDKPEDDGTLPDLNYTLEELIEITRSVKHRMPPKIADAFEKLLEEKKFEEIPNLFEDHAKNLKKETQ